MVITRRKFAPLVQMLEGAIHEDYLQRSNIFVDLFYWTVLSFNIGEKWKRSIVEM